jgi:GT2 family glycosyltransferase
LFDVSAIVVNFNSGEYLVPCIESLVRDAAGALRLEPVVVENASTVDQARHLEAARRLGARVLHAPRNLGYGGGCNLGARETSGRLLLFLNADVKACSGCLAPLARLLDADADLAFVEPRTYADDGLVFRIPEIEPLTPQSIARQTLARLSGAAALRESLRRTRAALPGWRATQPRRQRTLTGAFLMGRRETVDRLGGFDEGFPLYFEDADLFRRCGRAGLGLAMVPAAEAVHYSHRSVATAWTDSMTSWRVGRERWLRTAFGRSAVALDRACESVVTAIGRVHRPRAVDVFDELGARVQSPELELGGEPGPFLLELAIDPGFLLAAGHFGAGARLRFPDATWRSLLPVRHFVRALDPQSLALRGAWSFEPVARPPEISDRDSPRARPHAAGASDTECRSS